MERVPPSRPNVTMLSETSVLVEWSMLVDNHSLPIVLFKVQYQQLKPRRPWKTADDDIAATARRFEVHDLRPGLLVCFHLTSEAFSLLLFDYVLHIDCYLDQ